MLVLDSIVVCVGIACEPNRVKQQDYREKKRLVIYPFSVIWRLWAAPERSFSQTKVDHVTAIIHSKASQVHYNYLPVDCKMHDQTIFRQFRNVEGDAVARDLPLTCSRRPTPRFHSTNHRSSQLALRQKISMKFGNLRPQRRFVTKGIELFLEK